MPAFFIDRPVFAWVVALLICLGGLLAIPFLAVAQYPTSASRAATSASAWRKAATAISSCAGEIAPLGASASLRFSF